MRRSVSVIGWKPGLSNGGNSTFGPLIDFSHDLMLDHYGYPEIGSLCMSAK